MELFSLPTQGTRAVRSGQYGEAIVSAAFSAYGVPTVNDNESLHNAGPYLQRAVERLVDYGIAFLEDKPHDDGPLFAV